MDSFYVYRLPFSNKIIGAEGDAMKGLEDGFIISPFIEDNEALHTIIPKNKITLDNLDVIQNDYLSSLDSNREYYSLPIRSIEKEEHIGIVKKFISALSENEKAVCSRPICGEGDIILKDTFIQLESAYPEAMVFCFHSPLSGTWIGASPETLLSRNGNILSTMALAGTKKSDDKSPWDKKNIIEQKIVTDYISNILEKHKLPFLRDEKPYSKRTGPLQHLCTEFQIPVKEPIAQILPQLLKDLSPTPALCGFPKKKALNLIDTLEGYERGYYGGFFGPFNKDGDFALFVMLRALRIRHNRWCMYAGGGIMKDSIADSEWHETENKGYSIISKLIFKAI